MACMLWRVCCARYAAPAAPCFGGSERAPALRRLAPSRRPRPLALLQFAQPSVCTHPWLCPCPAVQPSIELMLLFQDDLVAQRHW